MARMVRTQISLTPSRPKSSGARRGRGVSMAALVRHAVDKALEADARNQPGQRALSLIGKIQGPRTAQRTSR